MKWTLSMVPKARTLRSMRCLIREDRMEILTFKQALVHSEQYSKRHLLLGNGFSIACRSDIFHYGSLYEEADFSSIPQAQEIFSALNTQDFEVAIRALETGGRISPIYFSDEENRADQMMKDASELKNILVKTIALNHPETPNSIDETRFWACREFLSNFIGSKKRKGGHIFTLNYDLLLYWTLMNDGNPFDESSEKLNSKDGFGTDEDEPDADYVVWQGETAAHSANILFLHGALHLYDSGSELQKYTWSRSGTPLVEQAQAAMVENKFPLFVSEGTSKQKKNKIRHNAYLYQCFKILTSNAHVGTHCFFIYGHSLAENDDHILKRLGRGKFPALYVSLFGSPKSETNQQIIKRARNLCSMRNLKKPLDVFFYDAESVNIWGD